MKLSMLAPACDLAVRRGWLLEQIDAVERGEFSFSIGKRTLGGVGLAPLKDMLLRCLRTDLAVCEQNLIGMGVEIGDAKQTADIPACRVETARGVVSAAGMER